eukprot:scaffold269853_cov83-Cyclotella_meneghiniana.AAC.1
MILEGNEYSIHKLAEFNLTYQCIGRGGEHLYLRYPECSYDSFFQAPDFDWTMIKQKNTKCALLFMDRLDYCLCPIWALAVFYLYGGLRRDGIDGATKDYVFPKLHNTRKDKVANQLTESIKRHIRKTFPDDVAKLHGIRSLRKGMMTMNRCNRSLSTQEEYARSGHTAPGDNSHAEGYIESTPAMSAPAGRALAGYFDPHAHAVPMSFNCISPQGQGTLDKFLDYLFPNDVNCLKPDGKLRELILSCGACLIGWYKHFKADYGNEHPIVKKIQHAAKYANI